MNITKETEKYVVEHPSIKDALKKGLINYSKLSRQIIQELSMKKGDFDAILAALRRLEYKLKKKKTFEKQIKELLKNTKLEIKNKIMVCILEKNVFYGNVLEIQKEIKRLKGELHIVEGVNALTLITEQEFEKIINKYYRNKIIKKNKDLIEIILRSPESLEEVPGVVGYLYSLFAENNVNILETLSCWTDTIFVIKEKDFEKTVKMLSF
ncbi:ACT domain-containing protein [Candidatus Woesearchaeota archaeon]|nr:ACT domain-containing protein [Candidatus Woesearchaeota archaeon]